MYWGLSEAGSWLCRDDPPSGGLHWGRSHNQKDAGKEEEELDLFYSLAATPIFFGKLSLPE